MQKKPKKKRGLVALHVNKFMLLKANAFEKLNTPYTPKCVAGFGPDGDIFGPRICLTFVLWLPILETVSFGLTGLSPLCPTENACFMTTGLSKRDSLKSLILGTGRSGCCETGVVCWWGGNKEFRGNIWGPNMNKSKTVMVSKDVQSAKGWSTIT